MDGPYRRLRPLPWRSFELALGTQVRFELGEHAEHVEEALTGDGRLCEGFRTPAVTNISTRTTAGVRKPPRDETAGKGTYWAVPRAQLWGFGGGGATAEVGSEAG